MADDVTAEQIDEAHNDGQRAASETLDAAPTHPLLRIAWARGFGQTDQLQRAIDTARETGYSWRQISAAVGENQRTVETKYGGGRERQRAYLKRKREGEGG